MIFLFPKDAEDFSTHGIGTLEAIRCDVEWDIGSFPKLEMEVPVGSRHFSDIVHEAILVVPTPLPETPEVTEKAEAEETLVYRVQTSSSNLRLRSGPGTSYKILTSCKKGTEVVVLDRNDAAWYKVMIPDGTVGWMSTTYLSYVRTELEAVQGFGERLRRPQPFTVYEILPGMNTITVRAMHKAAYDLRDNLIFSYKRSGVSGASALAGLLAACDAPHEYRTFCNIGAVGSLDIERKSPVEAIVGEDGFLDAFGGELMADWYDIIVAERLGRDRGLTVMYGSNMTGIEGSFDVTDAATRIVPVGSDKNGDALLLPEKYVQRDVDAYAHPKYAVLEVPEARVSGDLTEKQALEKLRTAAEEALDNGASGVNVSLTVKFIQLPDTVEYAGYHRMEALCPGDTVRAHHTGVGIDVKIRMVAYVYDAIGARYREITLGDMQETLASTGIRARQLPNGSIGASKLGVGAVGPMQLSAGAITYAKLDAAAVQLLSAQAISALTATINEVVAGSVTANAVTTAIIQAATAVLTTANISNANIDWAQIGSLNAQLAEVLKAHIVDADIDWASIAQLQAQVATLVQAKIGDAEITTAQISDLRAEIANVIALAAQDGKFDFAKIKDLVADAMVIEQGVGGTFFFRNLAATNASFVSATMGQLVIHGEDGRYYRIVISADGAIHTEEVSVTQSEISAGETSGGLPIVAEAVNADLLSAGTVHADSAILAKILTSALQAGSISASEAFMASASIPELYATAVRAVGDTLDLSANASIRLLVGKNSTVYRQEEKPQGAKLGDLWLKPSTGEMYQCADAAALMWRENGELSIDGVDALIMGDDGHLYADDAETFSMDEGHLLMQEAEAWVEYRPSKLKTSSITIEQDEITLNTGGQLRVEAGAAVDINTGSLNIGASGAMNVNAGAVRIQTADYQMILGDDEDSPAMDMTEGAKKISVDLLRAKALEAENLRPYEERYEVFSSHGVTLAEFAERVRTISFGSAEYRIDTEIADTITPVTFRDCTCAHIRIVGWRVPAELYCPPLRFERCTGSLTVENLIVATAADTPAIQLTDVPQAYIHNCWARLARHAVLATRSNAAWYCDLEYTGTCDAAAFYAEEGSRLLVEGSVPNGQMVAVRASQIIPISTVVRADPGTVIPLDAPTVFTPALKIGYYGTKNGWHAGELRQGYSDGKGQIFGCMAFTSPPGIGAGNIVAAELRLARTSGVGLVAACDISVYASRTTWGDVPAVETDMMVSRTDAVTTGKAAVMDVTDIARWIVAHGGGQMVLYTGETTTYSSKAYSTNYAQFTASLTLRCN